MPDPIVLDTSALADKGFSQWLRRYRGRKILPMVAFMEYAFFYRVRKQSYDRIHGFLRHLGIEVEPYQHKYAIQAIETMVDFRRAFLRDWRDHAIASHAHTAPLKVVTHNKDDFAFLGDRALTPEEARANL